MMALVFMHQVMYGLRHVVADINRPPDQDKLRIKFAREAIGFLDRSGGHRIHVRETRVVGDGMVKPSMIVSINYIVPTRDKKFADQHKVYMIDTTSWKNIRNDLKVLGKTFEKAYIRSYNDEPHDERNSVIKEYSELLQSIDSKLEVTRK